VHLSFYASEFDAQEEHSAADWSKLVCSDDHSCVARAQLPARAATLKCRPGFGNEDPRLLPLPAFQACGCANGSEKLGRLPDSVCAVRSESATRPALTRLPVWFSEFPCQSTTQPVQTHKMAKYHQTTSRIHQKYHQRSMASIVPP
jgi:hypothetical protein